MSERGNADEVREYLEYALSALRDGDGFAALVNIRRAERGLVTPPQSREEEQRERLEAHIVEYGGTISGDICDDIDALIDAARKRTR